MNEKNKENQDPLETLLKDIGDLLDLGAEYKENKNEKEKEIHKKN